VELNESPGAIIVSNHAYDLNALGAVRGLGIKGVRVTWITPDNSRWFYSKYCDPIICPDFTREEKRFIEFLIKLGKKRKPRRDVLIPTSDASLISISKNKTLLEKYFRPVVCDWETSQKFIDKRKIYPIANSVGVPTPETFYPQDEKDAKRISHEMKYPCLIKPSKSHLFGPVFKRKLFRVSNSSELIEIYHFLASKDFEIMIQEDIQGEDKNLIIVNTVFNKHSEPLALFMHRRIMQNPPRYGVVSLGESVWEPKLITPCLKLLKAINFRGIAQVEFKLDPNTREFKLIEVNGRSYLSISLPTACGLNLIHLAYKNAIDKNISSLTSHSCEYECGIKWLNLPSYIESFVKLRKMKKAAIREWVKPILNTKITFSTFSRNDTAPLLMELYYLIKNINKIIHTIGDKSLIYRELI